MSIDHSHCYLCITKAHAVFVCEYYNIAYKDKQHVPAAAGYKTCEAFYCCQTQLSIFAVKLLYTHKGIHKHIPH